MSWQNAGRIAGTAFNRVMPVVGGVIDYSAGKEEGEDDIRAAAGAIGSTAGGLAGAAKGAAIGAGIGSVVPFVGTAAGGLVGGLIGGIGGSLAGGWSADRADEFVRGKNTGINKQYSNNSTAYANNRRGNMTQTVDIGNGDVVEVDDNGNFIGWIAKGGVLVGGGNAVYSIGREALNQYQANRTAFNALNPGGVGRFNNAAAAQQVLGNARQVAGAGLRNYGTNAAQAWNAIPGTRYVNRAWNAIPGNNYVKGGALLAIGVDQLTGGHGARFLGRAIGGGADAIANAVGVPTDFDGQNAESQQGIQRNKEMQREEQYAGIENPYDTSIYQQGLNNRKDLQDYELALWDRKTQEARDIFQKRDAIARRNFMTEFTAKQAGDLLNSYAQMPESVARSIASIYQATR